MKPNIKRLVIELDANVHHTIKMAATERNMTIKNWVIVALVNALSEHQDQGIKNINNMPTSNTR
jgi:hypothetical protein